MALGSFTVKRGKIISGLSHLKISEQAKAYFFRFSTSSAEVFGMTAFSKSLEMNSTIWAKKAGLDNLKPKNNDICIRKKTKTKIRVD
jgi:hypothetical protein